MNQNVKNSAMKKFTFLVLTILAVANLYAQTYETDFAGTGDISVVDSVWVKNLSQDTSITLAGDDVLQLNVIPEVNAITDNTADFSSLQVYPNPMTEQATIEFFVTTSGTVRVSVYDLSGRTVIQSTQFLHPGIQSYSIKGLCQGMYMVQVNEQSSTFTSKLISLNRSEREAEIACVSSENPIRNQIRYGSCHLKSAASTIEMPYNEGDRLLFTGMSGNYATIVTDVPTGNKTITFDFMGCMDVDSNYYPVVTIGTQTWMAANLETTQYSDGTAIPLVTDNSVWADWESLTAPAYCWYDNNPETYKNLYGALYNWYTVDTLSNGGKNVCPAGWHMPTDDEWTTLIDYLGGVNVAGGKLKETGTDHWNSPNTGATNEIGFTALAGGLRDYEGQFVFINDRAPLWSSTQNGIYGSWMRRLTYNDAAVYWTLL
jgi:uncharacterized protein (TIGR02145 family)